MGKARVKLDISKLKEEFIFESGWIKSKQNLESEAGWHELTQAIMDMIKVVEEEFLD